MRINFDLNAFKSSVNSTKANLDRSGKRRINTAIVEAQNLVLHKFGEKVKQGIAQGGIRKNGIGVPRIFNSRSGILSRSVLYKVTLSQASFSNPTSFISFNRLPLSPDPERKYGSSSEGGIDGTNLKPRTKDNFHIIGGKPFPVQIKDYSHVIEFGRDEGESKDIVTLKENLRPFTDREGKSYKKGYHFLDGTVQAVQPDIQNLYYNILGAKIAKAIQDINRSNAVVDRIIRTGK